MAVEIITKEDLQAFRILLIEDINNILSQQTSTYTPWLKSIEVRKLLQISAGKLFTLRVKGILKYTLIGRIVYYRMEDIQNMLNQNNDGKDKGFLMRPHLELPNSRKI